MRYLITIFTITTLFGCTIRQQSGVPVEAQGLTNLSIFSIDEKPKKSINFTKDFVFSNTKKVIGKIGYLNVDDLGRIFIADAQEQRIHVFEKNGSYTKQIGREGRGPGEFGSIKSLQIRENKLYVFDSYRNQLNIFIIDSLLFKETVVLAGNKKNFPNLRMTFPEIDELYVRRDYSFAAKFRSLPKEVGKWENTETKGLLYLLDSNGVIIRKQLEFTSEISTNIGILVYSIKQYFGKTFVSFSKIDSIFLAEPKHFLVKVYSPDGDYTRAIYYPIEKIPMTEAKAMEANIPGRELNYINHSGHWPAINDMKIDDQDRIWVATTVSDMRIYSWWILESSGELIARFDWPRDEPVEVIKNDYMYTRKMDETGAEKIIRYQINFKEEYN